MFVEEGFRIRFANGEVIDFYADSPEEKRGWLKILGETIGHVPDSRGWCQLVLAKEGKAKAELEKKQSAADKLRATQQQLRMPPPLRQPELIGSYRPPPASTSRRPMLTGHPQVYR